MDARKAFIGFMAAVLVGLALWGVWKWEGTEQEEEAIPKEFVYELSKEELENGLSGDVLLYCSEEIMEGAAAAFSEWLKLQGVPVPVPGGPLVIAQLSHVPVDEELKPAQRAAIEVLKRYSPSQVVLLSHEGCIYYDTIGAWNDTQHDETLLHMEEELRAARTVITTWLPESTVRIFLARRIGNTFVFREIALSNTPQGG